MVKNFPGGSTYNLQVVPELTTAPQECFTPKKTGNKLCIHNIATVQKFRLYLHQQIKQI
jgi:hypothetical protein